MGGDSDLGSIPITIIVNLLRSQKRVEEQGTLPEISQGSIDRLVRVSYIPLP